MGSKLKLLPFILNIIKKLPVKTIFDGFSGSVRVSEYLKKDYIVYSNDKQYFSECLAKCYLLNKHPKTFYEKYNELPHYPFYLANKKIYFPLLYFV